MPTLTIFRVLGKHLVGLWGGLYMAAGIAHFVGWFWPDARSVAFLTAGAFFASLEISMTIRELRRGPMSTGLIILDCLPFLLFGGGVSLFLGRLLGQWLGSDNGGVVVFGGIYFCILAVIGGVKGMVQDRNLKEDLEHSPPANPEEDAQKHRRYMHPYI